MHAEPCVRKGDVFAVSQASSVMKPCLFSGGSLSLQGYTGTLRHDARSRLLWNHNCHVVPHLLAASAVKKPHLPSESSDALRLWLAAEGRKHCLCQGKGFVFILSGFCFVCAFILSPSLLTLMSCGWSLRHLEPASGGSLIQLGSLSSRVVPPQ